MKPSKPKKKPTKTKKTSLRKRAAVGDITERKGAERALREFNETLEQRVVERTESLRQSEEQFRTLADSIPNLAWWANADGYITWYNRRWYEYTGATPEQMEGWGWQSVHDPRVLPKVLKQWKTSIATGEPFDMEFPLRGADGAFRSFLTRVLPLKDADGLVLRWFGANTDISALKQVEEELRRTVAELREAQHLTHIGSWYWDTKTDVTTGSDELLRIYGFDPATQTMPNFSDQKGRCYPAEDWEKVNAAVQKTLQTGAGYELDVRAIRDNALIWITTRSELVRDAEGRIIGLRGTVQDTTERQRAEAALADANRALERERDLLQDVMNGAKNSHLVYLDRDFNFVRVNETYARTCGYRPEQMIGKNHFALYPHAENEAIFVRVRDTGEPVAYHDKPFEFPDQPERGVTYWDWTLIPIKDPNGRVGGLIFSLFETTERKRAEEALKTAHAELERRAYELEAVNRELESFSYTVSHDLKAPLRSIEGFTRALLEDYKGKLDATGGDYLLRVNTATFRMNQLIEAMLKMAQLTRGELQEKTVDLGALAQVIANDLQKQNPDRLVEFVITGTAKVNGDGTMLQVMLENLMHNAWKFTSSHAAARIEFGKTEMEGKTVYFVRDDGAGFDMRFADKLFMPFKRLHTEEEFPGLGIGLAIAHRIVLRHNGRLWAESAPEKGATFYFTL